MTNRRLFLAALCASGARAFQAKKEQPKKQPPKTEPLITRILRLTGISATRRGLKGVGQPMAADVWIVSADGRNKTQEKLTFDGGYRSPVFTPDDQKVLAIRGQNLVWVSLNDHSTTGAASAPPDLLRLVGFELGAANNPRVVVVTQRSVGLFSPWDGTFDILDSDTGDEDYIRGALAGGWLNFQGTLVSVNSTGHNLTIRKQSQEPISLTEGSKATYADPALSHDGAAIVFLRVENL